jgi:multicomponent Na+:H+ antiporter subunit G
MEMFLDILSWFLLLGGCFFCAVGGIGLIRLPDVYTRLHAAGVTDTLGAGMILTGLMVQAGFTLICVKLIMVLTLIFLTSPAATYALANSAMDHGVKPVGDERKESDHS